MKSMFQIIAAVACALTLTACGGGSGTPAATTPVVVQPAFQKIDTVVGTGTEAANTDLVVVSYTGWLYDASKSDFKGDKIDSSVDRNAPTAFTLATGRVLAGWDLGIVGMKVGGKRTLILPASLAYGANSKTAVASVGSITYAAIPANAALVFDIELVSVAKATVPVSVPPPTTLQVVDTVVGTGDTATSGKSLTVTYTGWLYDGTRVDFKGVQFDSNVGGTPLVVVVDAQAGAQGYTVPGFNQGVTGMKVGGKRHIVIPPSLGYGSAANGSIPANSTLIFDVELLTVK